MRLNEKIAREMHPFLKYPGGKSKEIPMVLSNLPKKVSRYIEPFVGGGSIFFAMNNAHSFINDKSRDLYLLYSMLKDQNRALERYLRLFDSYWELLSKRTIDNIDFEQTIIRVPKLLSFYEKAKQKKNRTILKFEEQGKAISKADLKRIEITARKTAFYMAVRELYNAKREDAELHAACFYFLREYCYSSMFRFSKNGDFNVPYGGMSYNEKYMKYKIDYMFSEEMKKYLADTFIGNDDFEAFLNLICPKTDDFIFLDPPYDSDFSTYDNNPFDKLEQIRLRDYLKKTHANWMLIIKKTSFISDLYKHFNIYEYDMNYMVSFKNRNDREVKHLLITNYKLANQKE